MIKAVTRYLTKRTIRAATASCADWQQGLGSFQLIAQTVLVAARVAGGISGAWFWTFSLFWTSIVLIAGSFVLVLLLPPSYVEIDPEEEDEAGTTSQQHCLCCRGRDRSEYH